MMTRKRKAEEDLRANESAKRARAALETVASDITTITPDSESEIPSSDDEGGDEIVSQSSDSESEILPALPASSPQRYTLIGLRNIQDNPIDFNVDDNYYDCFICVGPIAISELAITNCNHKFHETCLLNLMDVTKSCFECSGEVKHMISEIDTEEEYLKSFFEWSS